MKKTLLSSFYIRSIKMFHAPSFLIQLDIKIRVYIKSPFDRFKIKGFIVSTTFIVCHWKRKQKKVSVLEV